MLQTIQKASEVLALYDYNQTEWGVREVAARLNLAKSSAYDLLASLAQIGLLNRTEDGHYRLGWRLVAMSDTLVSTNALYQAAHPLVEELAEKHREMVRLAILNDTQVVFIDKVEGKQAVRVDLSALGLPSPHSSASGKVLLAHQPQPDIQRLLQAGWQPFPDNILADNQALERALETIRKRGYAYDLEEHLSDVCGVSAPVFDHIGKVIAALSMSIPSYRFHRAQATYRTATITAAKRISQRLGYDNQKPVRLQPDSTRKG